MNENIIAFVLDETSYITPMQKAEYKRLLTADGVDLTHRTLCGLTSCLCSAQYTTAAYARASYLVPAYETAFKTAKLIDNPEQISAISSCLLENLSNLISSNHITLPIQSVIHGRILVWRLRLACLRKNGAPLLSAIRNIGHWLISNWTYVQNFNLTYYCLRQILQLTRLSADDIHARKQLYSCILAYYNVNSID